MPELLDKRRAETAARTKALRERLGAAEEICDDKACVYATGSFARGEANQFSDLDLFIVARNDSQKRDKSQLKGLDEILLKAELIETTRELGIPDFSGDGEYLTHYTIDSLIRTLGTPEDDVKNTFTARLLLLLESSPLLGESVYGDLTKEVVAAYWRDFEDHKNDFMPAYLANDILRMWRTFCVNYEARTATDPPEKKAKRKLKNFKLKHSRLLTCYSGLLYLLAVYSANKTVSPRDAVDMISITPTQRLEWLLNRGDIVGAHAKIKRLIELYEHFLAQTAASEQDLINQFLDKDKSKSFFRSAYEFGDTMFDVLNAVGNQTAFHRLVIV